MAVGNCKLLGGCVDVRPPAAWDVVASWVVAELELIEVSEVLEGHAGGVERRIRMVNGSEQSLVCLRYYSNSHVYCTKNRFYMS